MFDPATPPPMTGNSVPRPRRGATRRRRGVTMILAVMAMLIIGSLSIALGIVSQRNLAAADSHLKVNRAMSAADTGLDMAARRLAKQTKRFVIEKGEVDAAYAADIWNGTWSSVDGTVTVLPPVGFTESPLASSLKQAMINIHLTDNTGHAVVIEPGDADLPKEDAQGVLHTRPICLSTDPNGDPDPDGPYFRLSYELHPTEPYVIVQSIGYDAGFSRKLEIWFKLTKRIEFAIVAPNRIMIGSNVRVEGPLGTRYGIDPNELTTANGDPLVMRSDFYGMNGQGALDDDLDLFFDNANGVAGDEDAMAAYDTDGDNQLRVNHSVEAQGIDNQLVDYDLDEYVNDFDVFLEFYDESPGDRMVVYDVTLAAAAGNPTNPEFENIDDQLARLIDLATPDRNDDGIIEECGGAGLALDCKLGYKDGVLDVRDNYAKVKGRLAFAVSRSDWESAHGEPYQTIVHGPIKPGVQNAAVEFEASDDDLRELTTDMFNDSLNAFDDMASAVTNFNTQVTAQDGDPNDNGGAGTGTPEWIDPTHGSFTDGNELDYYESTPYQAPGAYDYYLRPQYHNMEFTNLRIPMGNNGLFVNCTFKGVTFIETEPDCDYDDWNYMGAEEPVYDAGGNIIGFTLKYPQLAGSPIVHPTHGNITNTKLYSNNVRFHGCTFIGSLSARKPDQYVHWRNKFQLTDQTRFYIDVTDTDLLEQPDAADIIDAINALPLADREELAKSSIHCVGWSGDLGNFDNQQAADPTLTPKVKLKGTIIAGIMDIRGTADVFGTLLMTFRPVFGVGPLAFGGFPDAFNTTIGYFGADDGDGEGNDIKGGEITLRYDPDAILPNGVPWSMIAEPDPSTYVEGGTS